MAKKQKDALQIGAASLIALVLYFVLPEPVKYKGAAVDLLPLANYFVVICGISGIIYSLYLFLKRR